MLVLGKVGNKIISNIFISYSKMAYLCQNHRLKMIDGFKKETAPLTQYEEGVLLPLIIRGLRTKVGNENAITSTDIILRLKEWGEKINGPRLRKVINHIRLNNLVPRLCASSDGYWIEGDDVRLRKYIESLVYRAGAIRAVADSLAKDLYKIERGILP